MIFDLVFALANFAIWPELKKLPADFYVDCEITLEYQGNHAKIPFTYFRHAHGWLKHAKIPYTAIVFFESDYKEIELIHEEDLFHVRSQTG